MAGTDLGTISALSYNTFHDSDTTGFVNGNAALQLVIDFNGDATGGFTTLTYEPYLNGTVDAGRAGSRGRPPRAGTTRRGRSRAVTYILPDSQGTEAGLDSLADIAAGCPDAVVGALGVNIGSEQPGLRRRRRPHPHHERPRTTSPGTSGRSKPDSRHHGGMIDLRAPVRDVMGAHRGPKAASGLRSLRS